MLLKTKNKYGGKFMKNNKKYDIESKIEEIKKILQPNKYDPDGSYTGITKNGEEPVQDQDDL